MNEGQIAAVRDSFAKVASDSDGAAAAFYARLFEIDPGLRPMFKGDMTEQGRKLMRMLSTAVRALDKLEVVLPAVEMLGKRHAGYGVADKDYDTVGAALLATLAAGLGADFTAEVRLAWIEVYGALSQIMKSAANTARSAQGKTAEHSGA